MWNNKGEGKIPIKNTYSNCVPLQFKGNFLILAIRPIFHVLREK